jgi:hypothetical protein
MNVSSDKFSQIHLKGGITFQSDFMIRDQSGLIKIKPYVRQQWELADAGSNTRFAGATSATLIEGRDATLTQAGFVYELNLVMSDSSIFKIGFDFAVDELESRYLCFVGVNVKF